MSRRAPRRAATTGQKAVQVLLGFLVVALFTLVALAALVVIVKLTLPGR